MTPRLGLRGAAIAIAVAALVDPVFTVSRFDRALIAVVAGPSSADSALATRVRTMLSRDHVVVPEAIGAADGLVVVGDALPGAVPGFRRPSFAVVGEPGPSVTIERVVAPRASSPDAAVGVNVIVRGRRARGRILEVSLVVGDATVDRATSALITDDDVVAVSLSAIAAAASAPALRVVARLMGSAGEVTADAPLDFAPRRWNVLFHDGRPSWMSTFVRRAVEHDARFAATSRVLTSTNVATDAGTPPARLDAPGVRANYDVIVIGAPDALSDRDVAALDDFLRRRGGSVVLLLDARTAGPYDRLAATGDWSVRDGGPELRLSAVSVAQAGGSRPAAPAIGIAAAGPAEAALLRATEIAWPVALPAGAVALVADTAARPVIWSAPVGAGRLTVSGALDSWRFRDPSTSEFDSFWTGVIADEAARALPPLRVTMNPAVARPGEPVDVSVVLRDAALAAAARLPSSTSATVEARLLGPDTANAAPTGVSIRLLPHGSVGHLAGTFRAPAMPGDYRITVRSGPVGASAPLIVRADASVASGRARDALDPWVASRGGQVFPESELSRLGPAIRSAIAPEPRAEPWHPMRSPWWIVPFALLLSAEWWLRRRRGLA